jgi:arylsulfatase
MRRLPENVFINIKGKSHAVTAEIDMPDGGARGVIIAEGGITGGWSLYAHEGRLKYCYNLAGARYFYVEAAAPLPAGQHQVRMEFAYDGGGFGKGGLVSLFVDGTKVGEGRVERTHAFLFSMDETADVGLDAASPVSEDYGAAGNAFTGRIRWVQIDVDEAAEDADHMIMAEERFHLAMARQ